MQSSASELTQGDMECSQDQTTSDLCCLYYIPTPIVLVHKPTIACHVLGQPLYLNMLDVFDCLLSAFPTRAGI